MNYTLRPLQKQLLSDCIEAFKTKQFVLAQAPTGAGKTIMFCQLIKRFLTDYPGMRICVLVHREILVRQNADKLKKVWPEATVGIACASASKDVNVTAPVVFGSVQTLARRVGEIPPFHLVIVDEAHRLPPRTVDSQYRQFLNAMLAYYPEMRLFGLTATPYRLNHGKIYGDECKHEQGERPNWFDALDHQQTILDLQRVQPDDANPDAPYLCPLRVFVEDRAVSVDLASVKTTAGEFNAMALSEVMRGTRHITSAVDAYRKYQAGRSRCCVFAVDIAHAEDLVTAFKDHGLMAECVHSELPKDRQKSTLAAFSAGALPIIVNVGQLTEGWDEPATDLILMARPTLSAALFVQMVGRGLRIHPGKRDVLVLDLAGNFDRHGPPWDPKLPMYRNGKMSKKDQEKVPDQTCPECGLECPARQWTCPHCGAVLRARDIAEAKPVALRELNLDAAVHEPMGVKGRVVEATVNQHRAVSGRETVRIDVKIDVGALVPVIASHYFSWDGPAAWYAGKWWKSCVRQEPMPRTTEEAFQRLKSSARIELPPELPIRKDGKYWRVAGW